MIVYRIVWQKFANDLSGTGARLNGGRWNSPGVSVLYTSSYRSLALLEVLVHTTNDFVPDDLKLVSIEIPDLVRIQEIEYKTIRPELEKRRITAQFSSIGDSWIRSADTLLLKVPSVILPDEFNYLINPLHKEFHQVKIADIQTFDFDKRLLIK